MADQSIHIGTSSASVVGIWGTPSSFPVSRRGWFSFLNNRIHFVHTTPPLFQHDNVVGTCLAHHLCFNITRRQTQAHMLSTLSALLPNADFFMTEIHATYTVFLCHLGWWEFIGLFVFRNVIPFSMSRLWFCMV